MSHPHGVPEEELPPIPETLQPLERTDAPQPAQPEPEQVDAPAVDPAEIPIPETLQPLERVKPDQD